MSNEVRPGDSNMDAGGYGIGGNQEKQIVMIIREYIDKDRKYVYTLSGKDHGLHYFIMKGEDIIPEQVRREVRIKDHDGAGFLGRKGDRISLLGVSTYPAPIIVPISFVFADGTRGPGTATVDFVCDERHLEDVRSMVNSDFSKEERTVCELQHIMYAAGLQKLLNNYIGDDALEVMCDYDHSFNLRVAIRNSLFDKLDHDVAFAARGLIPMRASIRCAESTYEEIMRMQAEGKIDLAKSEMDAKNRMLQLELAREEYDFVRGV